MSPDSTPTSPAADTTRHHQILGPRDAGLTPIILCFHGSGEKPLPSWDILLAILSKTYRVVLFDRGPRSQSAAKEVAALGKYLQENSLKPRYVLVAHSAGGAIAKYMLHTVRETIAGVVLVETGQEGGLSDAVWKEMTKNQPLGDLPLVVVRGNTLIRKWKDLELAEADAKTDEEKEKLKQQREWLKAADQEDERLKREQLALSKNTKYVHLADCGHDVIRARPELVAEEVRWVIEQLVFTRRDQKILVKVSWWKSWMRQLLGK